MDELMEILNELRPDVDFANETALITDGILDSFDIVALVGELNDAFDIEIKPNNLVPDNFNSAKAMMALIEKLQDEFGLRPRVAVHIVDLVPKDLADMRLIFAKEPGKTDKEEMEKILEFLEQYDVEE